MRRGRDSNPRYGTVSRTRGFQPRPFGRSGTPPRQDVPIIENGWRSGKVPKLEWAMGGMLYFVKGKHCVMIRVR